MPGELGCGTHYVEVRQIARYDSDGMPVPVGIVRPIRLSGVVSGQYTRTFNAWGPASINVAGGALCDNVVSQLQPLMWEIRIMRGNEIAYSGPILRIVQRSGFAGVRIDAGDILAWFAEDGGRILNLVNMRYSNADPVTIAADVIRRTMNMVEPRDNLLITDYLYTNTVGETIDYAPGVTTDYLIDTLDDLTNFGLMFAAVGRRIILSHPATVDRAPVAHLTTADITGDATVTIDGTDMAVLGVAVRGSDPAEVFIAGEWGSPYGTPMGRVEVDDEVSDRSALNAARRATKGRTRPRVHIDMPTGTKLKSTAPIRFADLRPGSAHITVSVPDIPQPVKQSFQLTEARVSFAGEGQEEVTISVAPIGEPTAI